MSQTAHTVSADKGWRRGRFLSRGPVDLPFLMLVCILVVIGVIMLYSASYARAYYKEGDPSKYFMQQMMFALIGIALMLLTSMFNYEWFRRLSLLFLLFSVGILFLVLVPGVGVAQDQAIRWIKIPGLPQFQPSELTKLGVILYFSARMSKRDERKLRRYNRRTMLGRFCDWGQRSGFFELIPYGIILGVIVLALYVQHHMSATILILVVAASVLFAGGVKKGWFIGAAILAAIVLAGIIFTTDYMSARISIWLDPWEDPRGNGFQAIQSLLSLGSGGLMGLGFGNSRQKFLYLPAEHNDFIFAIVCEELGLIGATLILILFALLIVRGYWLAIHARDRFGTLVAVGIITLFAFQVVFNIGVVSGALPVTGISLPFFSYGGTALIIQLIEMGIVLAVTRQIPAPRMQMEEGRKVS